MKTERIFSSNITHPAKRSVWLQRITVFVIALLVKAMLIPSAPAQVYEEEDRSLSPYFFVHTEDSETDRLPLKSTSAEVDIAGVIAGVKVTQVYKNEGRNPLEAVYVFPGSTRAAVYNMTMTIGERVIQAKIEKKDMARQMYEEAKSQGKSASLLEQKRPNVFQMNVANIMPGDEIRVELWYTELLIPEDGVYEFVYPTVVGPRYSDKPVSVEDNKNDGWVANPYTGEGVKPTYTLDIHTTIHAGMPVKDVRCTSHDVNIMYTTNNGVDMILKDTEKHGGNRDFIVQYRLKGGQIESGLLLYEGKEENFFLAMIQPPKVVRSQDIPPREYIFIVDVSGSMTGYPLEISKKLMKDLLGNIRPSDRFNILLFASSSSVFSDNSLPATSENIQRAITFINNQRGGGGTQLMPALKRALAMTGTEDFSRTFVIATDGYVTVEKEAFDLIRNNLSSANFFPFGIGSSVNRYLIEGMAHAGQGEPFIITKPDEAETIADKFRQYIQYPVLTNIHVDFDGFQAYDVEPASFPDVLAERPVLIYGKYRGKATGSVKLTGRTGDKTYQKSLSVSEAKTGNSNSPLKYLWARERIRLLDDYTYASNNDNKQAETITGLGLKYNLLTNYTSFIAIDSEVRNANGKQVTVNQPLPLPQGVSNQALGNIASGAAPVRYNAVNKKGKMAPESYTKTVSADFSTQTMAVEDVAEEVSFQDSGNTPAVLKPEQEIFTVVETMPVFPGGEKELHAFLQRHMIYPETAVQSGLEGKVFVEFVVDKNGKVKDVKIVRGVHHLLDQEALRLIMLTSSLWTPGRQRGAGVDVKMIIPVVFKRK